MRNEYVLVNRPSSTTSASWVAATCANARASSMASSVAVVAPFSVTTRPPTIRSGPVLNVRLDVEMDSHIPAAFRRHDDVHASGVERPKSITSVPARIRVLRGARVLTFADRTLRVA